LDNIWKLQNTNLGPFWVTAAATPRGYVPDIWLVIGG